MNLKISEKVVLNRLQNKDNLEVKDPIGAYIKKERIAQGLNQDYVCKGICSVSYLSRIENNLVNPPSDFVKNIFLRLHKPVPNDLSINPDYEIIDNFLTAIEYKNKELIEKEYQHLKTLTGIRMELYELTYSIYNNNFEDIENKIKKLHNEQNYFNINELLIYLENLGSYYLLIHEYKKADKYLSLAHKILDHFKKERPLILYKFAWVLGKLEQDYKCIEYAQKALDIFNKKHNYYRSIQCQLLIAIKMSKRFPEKALIMYEQILKTTPYSQTHDVKKVCKYNLAILYKRFNIIKKSENLFLDLISEFDHDSQFIVDIYAEYIDLFLVNHNIKKANMLFEQLCNKNYNCDTYYFYVNLYYCVLKEENIEVKISNYKVIFIPYSIQTKNKTLELRFRKDYALLLEKNHQFEEAISEYKKIFDYMKYQEWRTV